MFKAKLLALSNMDEYEVTIEICGVELICFAPICPYHIEVGETYPVMLTLNAEEGESGRPKEIAKEEYKIEKVGKGYGYFLTGKLTGNKLDLGKLSIEDEYFDEEYLLNGKFIWLKVLGIYAEFLKV